MTDVVTLLVPTLCMGTHRLRSETGRSQALNSQWFWSPEFNMNIWEIAGVITLLCEIGLNPDLWNITCKLNLHGKFQWKGIQKDDKK